MSGVDPRVYEIVKTSVAARVPEAHIVTVDITEDVDFEDDPILEIRVVYETENQRLDAKKLSGLIRELRLELFDLGEDRFPILGFVSAQEYQGPNSAAA